MISTSFSEDIKSFEDYIYLAKDQDDYLQLIDVAIAENDTRLVEARIAVALKNTWEARWKRSGKSRPVQASVKKQFYA